MSQQETYNLVDYDSEEERAKDPAGPPLENQISAAEYIGNLIHNASGVYGLMGGFALLLRGSQRSTRDVDLVTNLKMAQVWGIVEGKTRIIIPTSRLTADVLKIFVKTGPGYDGCAERKDVEVDIALPGVKGTPSEIDNSTENINVGGIHVGGQNLPVLSSLDIPHVLRGKMHHYAERAFDRDFQDIVFLLREYEAVIREGAKALKPKDVKTFLESEDLSARERAHYSKVLGFKG